MDFRTESDSLGTVDIPLNVYWGIHTSRAINNFSIFGYNVPPRLIKALAIVKKACSMTNSELGYIDENMNKAIVQACDEIFEGKLDAQFPVDAIQGGAGTSTNMNINEVVANRALEIIHQPKGSYEIINPIEHVNLHQSTNDVYPTALKIASIYGLRELSNVISLLQGAFQDKEKEFAGILTIGRTEMQDAVPMTLGSQFASFSEAIARDRWRTFKCEERLRTVNIGGTAIGTGLTAPKKYIFLVNEKLRQLTNLGITRAEQVMDNTANADVFVEVSGILAAHSANLQKIAQDLRFLHFLQEINLKPVQAGSSIMPGKVNPVIMEAVISAALKTRANNVLISEAASNGTLQINEYLPIIALALLENIDILININKIFTKAIQEITANGEICKEHFEKNEIIITAFLPLLGYNKCEELIKEFKEKKLDNLRVFLGEQLSIEQVDKILSPENLISLGYR